MGLGNFLDEQDNIDVLVVEEDKDQRALYAYVLDRAGLRVACANDIASGIESLRRYRPKVVLCGHEFREADGADLCAHIHGEAAFSSTYVIVKSTQANKGLSTRLLNAGADDFFDQTGCIHELVARVRVGIRMWRMHHRLSQAAITDGLTGLYNHDHFNRLLDSEMLRSRRFGHSVAMIMVDLDHFKAVNDTFGHLAGNRALIEVSQVLRRCVREIDIVSRFGGEEFAIILPEATCADARVVAERIRESLGENLEVDELCHYAVTASFGVSDADDSRVSSAADLVDLADRMLYIAKRSGRNRSVCATDVENTQELVYANETNEVEWLRRRVQSLSVRSQDVYSQCVSALWQALKEKDPRTAIHAKNVAVYARQIAEHLGCSQALIQSVYNAALLHDIGKIGVSDHILFKPDALTHLERMVLDQAPIIGTRMIEHLRILGAEVQIIRHQREYYDGSGNPVGLAGDEIPIGSRILLVADAFDAMTTDRVYRERCSINEAMEELHRLAKSQFDPEAVAALRQLIARGRHEFDERIEDTVRAMSASLGQKASA